MQRELKKMRINVREFDQISEGLERIRNNLEESGGIHNNPRERQKTEKICEKIHKNPRKYKIFYRIGKNPK